MASERPVNGSSIRPDEVHLWYHLLDRVEGEQPSGDCLAILSEDEKARARRFVFERDRRLFLTARAFLRTRLSRYAKVPASSWRFSENEFGKPEVCRPAGYSFLRFNVSHTPGLVACVVAMDREVGVDVEYARREVSELDLARRFFSAEEARAIESCPVERRRERFFDYWTVKEAYVKARGLGLSLGLDRFCVCLEDNDGARISPTAPDADDARTWQFSRFSPAPDYRVAVAARRDLHHDLWITAREAPAPFVDPPAH
jgi:4'-phosphopantetheinyl transferase